VNATKRLALYRAALAADDVWGTALQKVFGAGAGDARYRKIGEGEEGSELRRLYEAKLAADRAFFVRVSK
jgi:hypothetical protein